MIKLALCDDDTQLLNTLETSIQNYTKMHPSLELAMDMFDNPDAMFSSIKEGNEYDIYILDIIMPKHNGIQVAKTLRIHYPSAVIIFLTSTKDFAYDAFSVNAFHYLLKPVNNDYLYATLNDALAKLKKDAPILSTIQTTQGVQRYPISDIVFVEIRQHTVYYHMTNNEVVKSVTLRIPFEEAIAELLDSGDFIQTHQSYAVNMHHIFRFDKKGFETSDGNYVPIAKLRYSSVKDSYMMFLSNE